VIEPLLEAERMMALGLPDQAERLYRSVAEADPRNSIAVVGLARVAIERGNDLEALRIGRRALRIDPDNPAAQRLVARLEEVLTVRGVPLPPDEAAPSSVGPETIAPERPAEAALETRPGAQALAAEPPATERPAGQARPDPPADASRPTTPVDAPSPAAPAAPASRPTRPGRRPSLLSRILRRPR
jgi:tetratricopeptide (TPR) repeat protein